MFFNNTRFEMGLIRIYHNVQLQFFEVFDATVTSKVRSAALVVVAVNPVAQHQPWDVVSKASCSQVVA